MKNNLNTYLEEFLREWKSFAFKSRSYIEQRFWWIYDFTFNGLCSVLIPICEVWKEWAGVIWAGLLDMRERNAEISPFCSWARPPNKANEREQCEKQQRCEDSSYCGLNIAEILEILYNLAMAGGVSMARDLEKKYSRDYALEKENYMRINLKIRNDSGIPAAMERVRATGKSANAYILEILEKKLREDGYLSD